MTELTEKQMQQDHTRGDVVPSSQDEPEIEDPEDDANADGQHPHRQNEANISQSESRYASQQDNEFDEGDGRNYRDHERVDPRDVEYHDQRFARDHDDMGEGIQDDHSHRQPSFSHHATQQATFADAYDEDEYYDQPYEHDVPTYMHPGHAQGHHDAPPTARPAAPHNQSTNNGFATDKARAGFRPPTIGGVASNSFTPPIPTRITNPPHMGHPGRTVSSDSPAHIHPARHQAQGHDMRSQAQAQALARAQEEAHATVVMQGGRKQLIRRAGPKRAREDMFEDDEEAEGNEAKKTKTVKFDPTAEVSTVRSHRS